MNNELHNLSQMKPLSSWRRVGIFLCAVVVLICGVRLASPNASANTEAKSAVPRTQSIESLRLGQRVVAINPQREETHAASQIDNDSWREVKLYAVRGSVEYNFAFLRPLAWLNDSNAVVGGKIDLDMPEIGMMGPAEVTAINPCPPIELDDGTHRKVVTGWMSHLANNVLSVTIEGEDKPLGVTDTHPMWSVDRQDFVQMGELKVGDRLERADGTTARIVRITPHTGPPVMTYNLEVDGEHVYRVGAGALLVHNNGCVPRGSNNEVTNNASRIGQEAHRQLQRSGISEWIPESPIDGLGVRKDGLHRTIPKHVRIIKPDTPTGRAAADARATLMGKHGYTTEIELYNPADPAFLPGSPSYIGPRSR